MTSSSRALAYRQGLTGGLPFMFVVVPFGLLFGVVALDAGLTLTQTMGMTMLVIAGAAQFTALQMMVDNAGLWLIIAAALAVNLRMAMYSAALVPHLGKAPLWQRALIAYMNFDQTYAVASMAYEQNPDWPVERKVTFFFGVATPIVPTWIAATLVGALIGKAIPTDLGIDFILPITFIALVGPMLKTMPQMIAASVSAGVGLLLAGLPSGMGLLIAAACAMGVGAYVEIWQEKRGATWL